jgi:hypothetical protein
MENGKQVSSIEFTLIEQDILFGLQQGNAVLKELHKGMDIDNVEKLLSETADGIAYQQVRLLLFPASLLRCSLHRGTGKLEIKVKSMTDLERKKNVRIGSQRIISF